MTGAARRLALAAGALLLAACGGDPTGLESSDGGRMIAGGGATARALDPALVGRWSRVVLLGDASGGIDATETRWTFRADGRLERRVIATNLTFGLADEIVTTGRWSTGGDGFVTITLDGEPAATLRLEYRIVARLDGAELALGGVTYRRLPT